MIRASRTGTMGGVESVGHDPLGLGRDFQSARPVDWSYPPHPLARVRMEQAARQPWRSDLAMPDRTWAQKAREKASSLATAVMMGKILARSGCHAAQMINVFIYAASRGRDQAGSGRKGLEDRSGASQHRR
jgi:hypothetical protein